MKTIVFDKDITVLYVEATSFPEGLGAAYEELHRYIPFSPDRKFLSVSRPENGKIIYRAGAEALDSGEAAKFGFETLILQKGRYLCISKANFMDDIPAMKTAFETLMDQPGLDPQGWCVEWYFNDTDVHCMIRLEE